MNIFEIVNDYCQECHTKKNNIIKFTETQINYGTFFNSNSKHIQKYCPECLPKRFSLCECGCSYVESFGSPIYLIHRYIKVGLYRD